MKTLNLQWALACAMVCIPISTWSKEIEEEIVVTATKLETTKEKVGSSISVISRKEIEERKEPYVLDLLRTVPGLDVVNTGTRGGNVAIFIRGAKSEQTLVLLDGIKIGDPISIGRAADLSTMMTQNIERIEILRGPQSTLYGSDAIGGVINIITQRGKKGLRGLVGFEMGSYGTWSPKLGVSGASETVDYSLNVSKFSTDGFSSASKKLGNTEDDGFDNTTLSGRVGWLMADTVEWDFIARLSDSKTDIDNYGGAFGDDPNNRFKKKQTFLRTQATFSTFDDLWEQRWGVSYSEHDRETDNPIDIDHPIDLDNSKYDSSLIKFDWQNNFYLHQTNTLTIGLETEEEKGKSYYFSDGLFGPFETIQDERKIRTNGYYIQDQIQLADTFFLTLGGRVDDHETFGLYDTYRVASSYLFEESHTRLHGSFGTGFKAPSLFQLYSSFGDENLEPEESEGWDFGIEQALWDNKIVVGVTYFDNDYETLIDYDFGAGGYINIDGAESQGVEFSGLYQVNDRVRLSSSYTYTDSEDKTTGEELVRRPKHKANFNVNYAYSEAGNLNLAAVYTGERDFKDFSGPPGTLKETGGHTIFNVAISHEVADGIEIFGRVDNILNKDYEEVLGYTSSGIGGYVGFNIAFGKK